MKRLFLAAAAFCSITVQAQQGTNLTADQWVDSVFNSLTKDQRIAQLMVVRLSEKVANGVAFYDKKVEELVRTYNIGGICLFQGGPELQANFINRFQSIAQTPILICIDAETGLGMRMDSVTAFPKQMMLGAVQDKAIVYNMAHAIGEQCKRMGIQVNYAPVVDVNNNPNNPVINERSFGEDKYKVAEFGIAYMKGLQDLGVMACAKHFPGHGDVSVDSHYDLPIINKTRAQLDSLELYPFHELFKAGVGSVMNAHLYIPVIDDRANRATSISYNNVTKLLRGEMGYQGLTFTDALEMKGVSKYFPQGEVSVESIIAGNDMLCLPGDVPASIDKIKKAIKKGRLSWDDIDEHVKRVLYAKYNYGLTQVQAIATDNLAADLNKDVSHTWQVVAENALTLLRNSEPGIFPLQPNTNKTVAYVGFGVTDDNAFAERMRADYDAHVYYFEYGQSQEKANALLQLIRNRYDVVIVGLHGYSSRPAGNYGVSNTAIELIKRIQNDNKTISFVFGNPYVIKNFCDSKTLIACYADETITQNTAADLLNGKFNAKGKLPVTVCPEFKYGDGILTTNTRAMPVMSASLLGFKPDMVAKLDNIVDKALAARAFPGCVVLVAREGKIAFEKAYGHLTYNSEAPVYTNTIYDVASVTKILATTLSVMKLYEDGKLDINKTLGDYLPWVAGTNKARLIIKDVLLHQAGLKAYIAFYKETIDLQKNGKPLGSIYSYKPDTAHKVQVAENLYLRNDWIDTMYNRILKSDLGPVGKYVYSDNDFIFLGKLVEQLSGMPLNRYVKINFYDKLALTSTGFLPLLTIDTCRIAPTEKESYFRNQLLRGTVHDPGAAMFGGVAGHAGLFSDVYDMAVLGQMLLNGGTFNGVRLLHKPTIDLFTSYQSSVSRRGLGFDKPEKDNATRREPYPALGASPLTFGHTGFTGTCIWMDPAYNLTFVFLSNRVYPSSENNKLSALNVRGDLMEAVYKSMKL